MTADLYIPYGDGHLPLRIVKVETIPSAPGELKSVTVKIECESIGAPVQDPTIRPLNVHTVAQGL